MPLVAAVISPHPPLLISELAAGASGELDDLRAACVAAIARMLAAAPDLLVVVGAGPTTRAYPASSFGTFAGFGFPLTVNLSGSAAVLGGADRPPSAMTAGADRLPTSLAVGAWLLSDLATGGPVTVGAGPVPRVAQSVSSGLGADGCAAVGGALAHRAARVGLLVMGDGSACRSEKAPGYADPRAEAFDASVTSALRAGTPEALLALDIDLAGALLAAGRAPWQVLAGAALATGSPWIGGVTYDAAPYGVQYTVATWTPA